MTTLSVLDLAPITEGGDAADALANMLDLARHVERLGFNRYWLAEHHGMPGIASAATSVVIGQVAAATERIRVGAGGVMLPNHAPLVIAEQFGTLASLYPGRIDLGLGRAPGTDQTTVRALRRDPMAAANAFPQDVAELMGLLAEPTAGQQVHAIPGEGTQVPIWILGSSTFGAQLAAKLGLPYAFASHFAPAQLDQAIATYRDQFQPSAQLAQPYVMLGYNMFAADTDERAWYLASSMQQMFLSLRRGKPGKLPRPVDDFMATLSEPERAMLQQTLACSAIGSPETVSTQMRDFVERYQPDEMMLTSQIFDHQARLRSYEIAAEMQPASA